MTRTAETGRLPRRAGPLAKVTGQARYGADVWLPGTLVAKVLRSPHPHARLLHVDAGAARRMPGVRAVVTRDDLWLPTPAYGYYVKDQPLVATDRVRYAGDVVAAVAAEDEATALDALGEIDVAYDPLPALDGLDAAQAPGAPALFPEPPPAELPPYGTGASARIRPRNNVAFEFRYEAGGLAAWDRCDHVFEDVFLFSRMQHFHLEPFVTLARAASGRVELWTSTQNPFQVRSELARTFGRAPSAFRVHVLDVGGGFGAKDTCKTEPLAVLLAERSGRPVRYCLTTEEAFLTNSQHAARLTLRTGVTAGGRFVARDSVVELDAGAYTDVSPRVTEKAGYRMQGPYRWERISTTAACVLTNTTPAGGFRGFGGTQATWASESQVDMIAHRLGMDPCDLRRRNFKRLGELFAPGDSAIDSDLAAGLDVVVRHVRERARPGRDRGIGFAVGLKDSGGGKKAAEARVEVGADGRVRLHAGAIELGQGATSALARVVARILVVPTEWVTYAPIDTDATPFDQGTGASSAVAVTGQAVLQAAEDARRQVLAFAAEHLGCEARDVRLEGWAAIAGGRRYSLAPLVEAHGGPGLTFVGHGSFEPAFTSEAPLGAQFAFWEVAWAGAEVSVDRETGQVTVHQLVVSSDAGHALDELVCRGQDEGAAMMGLGQALFERMLYDRGRLLNGEALDYRVPLAGDVPPVFFAATQQQGHGPGPFGAKGIGEGPTLCVAPAVANAVEDAVGARVTALPLDPERVLGALSRQAGENDRTDPEGR